MINAEAQIYPALSLCVYQTKSFHVIILIGPDVATSNLVTYGRVESIVDNRAM